MREQIAAAVRYDAGSGCAPGVPVTAEVQPLPWWRREAAAAALTLPAHQGAWAGVYSSVSRALIFATMSLPSAFVSSGAWSSA